MKPFPLDLVAEKVETYEEFQAAWDMGFSYFQGYFFSKPEVLSGKDISIPKMNLIGIMAEANKEDFEFDKLESIISRDLGISYKLLRYVNSAFFKRRDSISSIRQAIVLLGEKQIRQFVSLIAMSNLAPDKPSELIRGAVIRAKFCELAGALDGGKVDAEELFTLGLFSFIDAVMDDSMETLMRKLPLSDEIKNALISGDGVLGDYLKLASGYERADWKNTALMASRLRLREEGPAQVLHGGADLGKFVFRSISPGLAELYLLTIPSQVCAIVSAINTGNLRSLREHTTDPEPAEIPS